MARLSARPKIEARRRKGNAAAYVERCPPSLAGLRVFLVCRASKERQGKTHNPEDQKAKLEKIVADAGGEVVGSYCLVFQGSDPVWLRQAVREAQAVRADVLLAESISRLIRHPDYDPSDKDYSQLQATDSGLKELQEAAQAMRLMTYHAPDIDPGRERSEQTKRGQAAKGKGGRPKKSEEPPPPPEKTRCPPGSKKAFRLQYRPEALRLRAEGLTMREIADEVSSISGRRVNWSTIDLWVKDDHLRDKR